jgi:C-terminal processing protease CtpA/Prc
MHMKKLGTQIIMVVLAMSALMAQEGLKTDCKKQCLVSRVIEEGVMLGVKVNGISKCTPLARINEIVPQSAADKAGLQMGDLILKINDAEVS